MERGPNILHQIKNHGLIGKPTTIVERIKKETLENWNNSIFLACFSHICLIKVH